jgi:hypothetical protein
MVRMRTARAGIRQCTQYFFVVLTAIGAMVVAGSARAELCVENKRLLFNGTEELTVTALGTSTTFSDPLIATVETETKDERIRWRSWDEHGNFSRGKIKPRSDRKFKVRLSRESRQDWEDIIELWLEELFPGGGASGELAGYKIKGKCNTALTRVRVNIWATFVGSAGGGSGTAEYFGQMTADLD